MPRFEPPNIIKKYGQDNYFTYQLVEYISSNGSLGVGLDVRRPQTPKSKYTPKGIWLKVGEPEALKKMLNDILPQVMIDIQNFKKSPPPTKPQDGF